MEKGKGRHNSEDKRFKVKTAAELQTNIVELETELTSETDALEEIKRPRNGGTVVLLKMALGGALMDWIREKAAKDAHENMATLVAGLVGPDAARPLEAYVPVGEDKAIPNAVKPSQEAYAGLEALGKALLEEEKSEAAVKAEEEKGLAEWEKDKPEGEATAEPESIADSVSSFMSKLW